MGERLGDPLLFIGVRHSIGHLLHLLHRIAHRDTISAAADHLDIVFRISKSDDLIERKPIFSGDMFQLSLIHIL